MAWGGLGRSLLRGKRNCWNGEVELSRLAHACASDALPGFCLCRNAEFARKTLDLLFVIFRLFLIRKKYEKHEKPSHFLFVCLPETVRVALKYPRVTCDKLEALSQTVASTSCPTFFISILILTQHSYLVSTGN